MGVLIRHSQARNGERVKTLIDKFVERVIDSQKSERYLVDCVTNLISRYENRLKKHLDISNSSVSTNSSMSECIWEHLRALENQRKVEAVRERKLIEYNSKVHVPMEAYRNFLKALYPKGTLSEPVLRQNFNWTEKVLHLNNSKYSWIDHDWVFRTYMQLPQPRTTYLKPMHFEDFLRRFLRRRNFIKPNMFSKSYTGHPQAIARAFDEMLEERKVYMKQFSKILTDMAHLGLPLSIEEKNQVIFYRFFKDDRDVMMKLKCVPQLRHESQVTINEFTKKTYEQIKLLFEKEYQQVPIDSYNLLLFLAIRHDQYDVIKDILKDLGIADLAYPSADDRYKVAPNRQTYLLLFELFSSVDFRKLTEVKGFLPIANLLDHIVHERQLAPDVLIINSIIKSLVKTGHLKEAEILVARIFIDQYHFGTQEEKDPNRPQNALYKLLTSSDKELYRTFLKVYDETRSILETNDSRILLFAVLPTESTFRELIKAYCLDITDPHAFEKTTYLMKVLMTQYQMPITTRTFQLIYEKFRTANKKKGLKSFGWDLQGLNYITSQLISNHDVLYHSNRDLSIWNKIGELDLSPELKHFTNNYISSSLDTNAPYEKGNFLKLSDNLINHIHRAYVAVIKNSSSIEDHKKKDLIQKVSSLWDMLCGEIHLIRKPNQKYYKSSAKEVHKNDEVVYLKKNFLIDIIYILSVE